MDKAPPSMHVDRINQTFSFYAWSATGKFFSARLGIFDITYANKYIEKPADWWLGFDERPVRDFISDAYPIG